MPLQFPSNPSVNDTYTFNGKTWVWNGDGWALEASGAINGIVIGNATAAAGTFTTLTGANAVIATLNVNGQSNMGGHVIPTANITYDLGNSTNRWNDIWLANSTIHIGNAEISANATSLTFINPEGGTTVLSGSTPEIDATTITASGNITGDGVLIKDRGILYLYDLDSSNYIGHRAPSTLNGNFIYQWPTGYGNASQVLTTNGSGGLSWADGGGGGGGGSATQYPNSTVQPVPGSTGNFDLSYDFVQTSQETPFDSAATDPFGVNLGEVYSMMDPVGEILEPVDLGVLT